VASLQEKLGDYIGTIEVSPPGEVALYWYNPKGKRIKSTPKPVRDQYPKALVELRAQYKQIQQALKAQSIRLESFFKEDVKLTYGHWQRHFIDHPLMQVIASALVWQFEECTEKHNAIWFEGRLTQCDGHPLKELGQETSVSLWHPLLASEEEKLAWCNFIWENKIAQPFRQVFRECYTPDERVEQSLFTGLYVRQHQFRALLKKRGWRYEFRGSFESDSCPSLKLDNGVTCRIAIGEESHSVSVAGIALAVEICGIEFTQNEMPIDATEITPLIYSEVIRDIDLFTSVSGIGLKSDWAQIESLFKETHENRAIAQMLESQEAWDRLYGQHTEMQDSFNNPLTQFFSILERAHQVIGIPKTVKTRALLLDKLIENTRLASKVHIQDNFVVLEGQTTRYKINLGSGLLYDAEQNQLIPHRARTRSLDNAARGDILLSRIYTLIQSLT